jgi:hypothetical protein
MRATGLRLGPAEAPDRLRPSSEVGPITIFDKSALQALSVDEAALFGQFYSTNLTPLFFVETLADLEKKVRQGRTPEQVVGTIARKTANLNADPSVHHQQLMLTELLGHHDVLMDGRPHVSGGRSVRSRGGNPGVVFEISMEVEALNRWQHHRFLEIERDMARHWRRGLQRQRHRRMNVKEMFRTVPRPRTLEQVKQYAEAFTRASGGRAFISALDILRIQPRHRGPILQRWLDADAPPLEIFAPYTGYLAAVQVFFRLAVSLDLISGDRPSNSVDIAYLYYLPFCQVFTSSDKLHAKTVPLFMRPNQRFVRGGDLKADLQKLDSYFSAQPQEVLDRGMMHFHLPTDESYLTTRLHNLYLPGWRAGAKDDVKLSSEKEAELIREFKEAEQAPSAAPVAADEAQFVILKRRVPVKMGKWRIIEQVVAERSWEHERREREKKRREAEPQAEASKKPPNPP